MRVQAQGCHNRGISSCRAEQGQQLGQGSAQRVFILHLLPPDKLLPPIGAGHHD
jgi:hypothetical protein